MPQHKGLNLRKFVNAVEQQLLERYFVDAIGEDKLPQRILMNDELTERFLNDPENVQYAGVVLEHFRRVNDLATAGKSTLVWTYSRYRIAWRSDETPHSMALRLYLQHEEAFDDAYTWYTWYNCASRMSEYGMPSDAFALTEERVAAFKQGITEWFSGLAKGDVTNVRFYDQDGATVILVTHGTYVRTVAAWEGEKVTVHSFRPATEDILVYDPVQGSLRIKATLPKDRDQYLLAFAGHVLGDEAVAARAHLNPSYTLEPFRAGRFDYTGNKDIAEVTLLEAKLQLSGPTEPKLHLKSKNLHRTLAEELSQLSLGMGLLTYVKLRFSLRSDGKDIHENVEITPPERGELQGKHQEVISQYLRDQRVKLKG